MKRKLIENYAIENKEKLYRICEVVKGKGEEDNRT